LRAPNKSFFSGLHLAITGFAAFVTAVVAIVGLAISQGWLSGNAKSGGGGGGGSAPGSVSTVAVPAYSVDPTSIVFQPLGATTASVKVTNTGVVAITVEPPTLTDSSHFGASAQTCDGPVDAGRSCQVLVTFKPAPGTFSATLVIRVTDAPKATEVSVKGTAIL
jgi:hypothetical protein